jgi:hypothetical protein
VLARSVPDEDLPKPDDSHRDDRGHAQGDDDEDLGVEQYESFRRALPRITEIVEARSQE